VWLSPQQGEAILWVDDELANLRSAFRWIVDRGDHELAATLASRMALLSTTSSLSAHRLGRKLLEAGAIDEPILDMAAPGRVLCYLLKRAEDGVCHGEAARLLREIPAAIPS
jgi:hypothetical protein